METKCTLSIRNAFIANGSFEDNFSVFVSYAFPGATYEGVYDYSVDLKRKIERSKFPATQLVISPCHSNVFYVHYNYNGKEICTQSLKVNDVVVAGGKELYDISVKSTSFADKAFEVFKGILDGIWRESTREFLERYYELNGVNIHETASVVLDYYEPKDRYSCNSVKVSEKVAEGTWEEIFDTFTTLNDRLRYCNGSYYKFQDPKLRHVMQVFIRHYNGDWYLRNALKRGVIID